MVWTCSKNGRGKVTKRSYEMASTRRRKQGSPKLTWAEVIRGMMGERDWWRKAGTTDATGGRR
jgi:hypothetical protein